MPGNEPLKETDTNKKAKDEDAALDLSPDGQDGPALESDYLDTDLSDLPPPRRRGRHPLMMVLVILFSGVLLWMYHSELLYFFSSRTPIDLGSSMEYKDRWESDREFDPGLPENRLVTLSGLTGLRSTADNGKWAFFKLSYLPVYVQVASEQGEQDQGETLYVTVSGRLRRMADTSRYDQLQSYYRQRHAVSFTHAYILEAGKKPADFWWAPLLCLVFVSFIGINLFLLVRHLRQSA